MLTGVKLRSTKDDSIRDLKIDGLFLAIGHVPNTAIFQGQLAMTPEGYLLTRTALAWKGVEVAAGLLDTLPNLRNSDQRRGSLRLRRRRRHPLPPGDHGGRLGLRRRHGLREMARVGRRRGLEPIEIAEPSSRLAMPLATPIRLHARKLWSSLRAGQSVDRVAPSQLLGPLGYNCVAAIIRRVSAVPRRDRS